jgi:hypothetical protein
MREKKGKSTRGRVVCQLGRKRLDPERSKRRSNDPAWFMTADRRLSPQKHICELKKLRPRQRNRIFFKRKIVSTPAKLGEERQGSAIYSI